MPALRRRRAPTNARGRSGGSRPLRSGPARRCSPCLRQRGRPAATPGTRGRRRRPSPLRTPRRGRATCAARWMAFTPIHGRAEWARTPVERRAHGDRALAPGFDPAAGRLEKDREIAVHELRPFGEQHPQPVVLVGDLFAFVEHERDVVTRVAGAPPRARSRGAPRGRPSCPRCPTRTRLSRRGGARDCRWPAPCRGGRRARSGDRGPARCAPPRSAPTRATERLGATSRSRAVRRRRRALARRR